MKIVSGSSNEPLARAICKSIGIDLGQSTIKPFPESEAFVKIEENVRAEDVYPVQSSNPPTNHHLMEMFIMIDALHKRLPSISPDWYDRMAETPWHEAAVPLERDE